VPVLTSVRRDSHARRAFTRHCRRTRLSALDRRSALTSVCGINIGVRAFAFRFVGIASRSLAALVTASTATAQSSAVAVPEVPQATVSIAIAFMLAITVLKLTAFILGYLIVRLGHDTLIKGVTGELNFGFKGGPISGKLKAASPGALFVLAGGAIIAWGLFVEKPMDITYGPPKVASASSQQPPADPANRLPVPGP
jgi:hypothetical protein